MKELAFTILGIILGLLLSLSIIDDMDEFTIIGTDKTFKRVESK